MGKRKCPRSLQSNFIGPVVREKYSALRRRINRILLGTPPHDEGRTRRHERGGGIRWTRRRLGRVVSSAEPVVLPRSFLLHADHGFGPGQEIHQMRQGSTILTEVHHARASNGEMAGDAQMAAHHVDELRIALGGPDRGGLTENPEQ
jgi:hypothetical protein